MSNGEPASYDLRITCPLARWRELPNNQVIYGIDDFKPCAVITGEDHGKPFAWGFQLTCAVHSCTFISRKDTRSACLEDVSSLLKGINCPGHIWPHPPDAGT
jgi:hypothetical protein